ncbi:MAG: glycerol-3-phosphate transporter, partial [Comamonadaceae bacterium]|nr:glycerol-3-phosphate transporter [Comamonadaceae bacterium]
MIERRPVLDFLAHAILILGVAVVAFPVYLTLVASTHSAQDIAASRPLSLLPGGHALETYRVALLGGETSAGSKLPAGAPMMLVSLISALIIALGKIAISLLSAFAIVYFRFPL